MDERRFQFAIETARHSDARSKQRTLVGGGLALAGFSTFAVLAANGLEGLAGLLIVFLATIVGSVIGSRLFR